MILFQEGDYFFPPLFEIRDVFCAVRFKRSQTS